jgi:hypothetical protein
MDVHPPHGRIHGWQDFLVHLLTITIGLLIALTLQGVVEWIHHRHLVHEARASISREMTENHQLLATDLTRIQQDETRILADIKTLVALRSGGKLEHGSLEYHVQWSSFDDSAWRAAETTGAFNYMDYQTARALADIYDQQRLISSRGVQIFDAQSRAVSPVFISGDPNQMSKEETQLTLQRSADLLLDLRALEQLLTQFDVQLSDELKKQAAHR